MLEMKSLSRRATKLRPVLTRAVFHPRGSPGKTVPSAARQTRAEFSRWSRPDPDPVVFVPTLRTYLYDTSSCQLLRARDSTKTLPPPQPL